jgi:hypothetical protein
MPDPDPWAYWRRSWQVEEAERVRWEAQERRRREAEEADRRWQESRRLEEIRVRERLSDAMLAMGLVCVTCGVLSVEAICAKCRGDRGRLRTDRRWNGRPVAIEAVRRWKARCRED